MERAPQQVPGEEEQHHHRNGVSGWGPGAGTIPGVVTGTTGPSAETVEWAGPAAMAELSANGAESWLATVPDTTLEPSDGN